MRIWNAWKLPKKRRKTSKEKKAEEEKAWMQGIMSGDILDNVEEEVVGDETQRQIESKGMLAEEGE